ncbi:sigma-70 family RNA polymerase sigma factor [Adhaeribacter sp. BT258]|uniref:Sigma-70 family RNA polymerase sigma factor n=2 Tax=Adhaeribacter terrigena TaxID=2793070 RepID=A0ABS1BX05_9BACT|nr:sigma-70 family RNA polymerase sigma factor [Adhaeribacter terrigena]
MMAVCSRYAKTRFEAEDVFHEAFVKVFKNIHTYQSGSFEGWMKRIFVNTAINNYRQNKKHYNHDEFGVEHDFSSETDSVISGISTQELLDIVNQLPEGYRLVFNMFAVEGYTHKEIGELLGIAEGTSKSQLAKAKQLLKKLLSTYSLPQYAN